MRCTGCGIDKQKSDFYWTRTKVREGQKYRSHQCKACEIVRIGEMKKTLRKNFIAYGGGKCNRCGYFRCIEALEFHHLNMNEKEIGINKLRSLSDDAKRELDKCELLCANCHREAHWLKI